MDDKMHELSNDLLVTFHAEAAERLTALIDNLRQMQAATTPEAHFSSVGGVFANLQSLRGAAASVAHLDLQVLTQAMEDVLARVRYDDLQLAPGAYDMLHRALATGLAVVQDPQGRHAKQVSESVEALTNLAEEGLQSGLLIASPLSEIAVAVSDDATLIIDDYERMQPQAPEDFGAIPVSVSATASADEPTTMISPQAALPVEEMPVSVSADEPTSLAEPVAIEEPTPIPPVIAADVPKEPTPTPVLVVVNTPEPTRAPVEVPSQPSLIAPDVMDSVRAVFRGEAEEHLENLEAGLLTLEKARTDDERTAVLERTFRSVHSLKGAARAVGLTEVQSVCQALETVFAGLKSGELLLSTDGYDCLHQALDTLNALLDDADDVALHQRVDDTIDQLQALVDSAPPVEIDIVVPQADEPVSTVTSGSVPVDVQPPPPPAVDAPRPDARPAERLTVVPRQPRRERSPEETPVRTTTETIRVATAKLDALLLQAEEMLTIRQAAGERTTELREILESLTEWRKEWNKVSTQARKLQRIYEGSGEHDRQAQPYLPLAYKLIEFLYWNESHFSALEGSLKNVTRAAERDQKQAGTLIGRLLDDTKKVLMLPFASLLNSFPKMVRDFSRTLNKDVELTMHGTEVEIDKRILDTIKDPLIHLLRNCVDHGIERPDVRTSLGKDTRGTVSISVSQVGVSKVEILVSDDGAGIDRDAVVHVAVAKGLLSEAEAQTLDERSAIGLIFQSDVSTSATVTDLSGRGLGMAIVRENVERLGGQIWVDTTPGHGTIFRIILPLTLATFRGFFVEAGGSQFVIPTMNVERVVRFRPSDIKVIEDVDTVLLGGRPVGLARLHAVLDIPAYQAPDTTVGFQRGLVLTSGDRRVLIGVDQIVNEQEVLFKNLGTYLTQVLHVSGVTVLGSGKVVPILDVPNVVRTATEGTAVYQAISVGGPLRPVAKRAVLLAEDSVTSRMLLKGILEGAGYAVTTAVDGLDALSQLERGKFDLVVSDVEMPRMNGFELTETIRSHEKHLHLPVVLVTGLESPTDRERGMEAGASAYIVKGDFTQNDLLATVKQFAPALAA